MVTNAQRGVRELGARFSDVQPLTQPISVYVSAVEFEFSVDESLNCIKVPEAACHDEPHKWICTRSVWRWALNAERADEILL